MEESASKWRGCAWSRIACFQELAGRGMNVPGSQRTVVLLPSRIRTPWMQPFLDILAIPKYKKNNNFTRRSLGFGVTDPAMAPIILEFVVRRA